MKRSYRLGLTTILLGVMATTALSQEYRYEVGAYTGSVSVLGDANKRNPIYPIGVEAGAIVRYNTNLRWAYSGTISYAMAPISIREDHNAWPQSTQPGTHTSHIVKASIALEHNFLPYSDKYAYLSTSRLTPYLLGGLDLAWTASWDKGAIAPGVSLGIGLKYKIKNRTNLFATLKGTHFFGDKLDAPTQGTAHLSNPYQITNAWYKGGDGMVSCVVGFSYEWGSLRKKCTTL